jgi:hypothetical protein
VNESTISGGSRTWDQAVADLTGWTCLWQDLDGLHVASAPSDPPPTSILWAWSEDGAMARLRMAGDNVYFATCPAEPVGASREAVLPWLPADKRVHGATFAPDTTAGLDLRLEQVVVDGIDAGAGPITFQRPART